MTTLAEYLTHKRDAFRALRSRALSPATSRLPSVPA